MLPDLFSKFGSRLRPLDRRQTGRWAFDPGLRPDARLLGNWLARAPIAGQVSDNPTLRPLSGTHGCYFRIAPDAGAIRTEHIYDIGTTRPGGQGNYRSAGLPSV